MTHTPVPTGTEFAVTDIKPYPNPVPIDNPVVAQVNIEYFLTQNADAVTFKLFTSGYRLVRRESDTGGSAGWRTFVIDKNVFNNLSSGIYFFVIEAEQGAIKKRSEIGRLIIIR